MNLKFLCGWLHVKKEINGEKCELHEDVNARQVKLKKSTTSNNKSWVHRTFILENNII